ncbi:MAG TPA: lysylphosphatidylglycerol synthase domain-containing protein [Candidatus Hydrogenedens sp.]|nr:lysylphosphatidylglycerol synthase domain-containing protein [Candidatus Hydrogenedens sp.]
MIHFSKNKIQNAVHLSGFIILAILTIVGVYQLKSENLLEIKNTITSRWGLFLGACGLRLADWILDFMLWRSVVVRARAKSPFVENLWIYLSQGAGIVLPAQLGRVLRAYVLSKATKQPITKTVSIEFFYLLCVCEGAIVVILISLGFYSGFFMIPLGLCFVSLFLFPVVLKISNYLLKKWNIFIPEELFDFHYVIILSVLCSIGWAINGIMFYLLLGGSESGLYLSQVQIIILGNILLAICSGIPGGIGIIETTLSISLHWINIQLPEIIVSIGLFRIITFWIWIPFGWLALFKLKLHKLAMLVNDSNGSFIEKS